MQAFVPCKALIHIFNTNVFENVVQGEIDISPLLVRFFIFLDSKFFVDRIPMIFDKTYGLLKLEGFYGYVRRK